MKYPKSIQDLIDYLVKLPTVGPKTAERYVFYLLNQPNSELEEFSKAVKDLKKNTHICSTCFCVSDKNPCSLCSNPNRDLSKLCIVSNTREMIAIESSKEFSGHYHVLGGNINTIKGTTPDGLKIKELLLRLKKNNTSEIIIATNPNLEGETTAMYINKLLKKSFPKIKISRIAKGLPVGSDIEYADQITIINALKYRNEI